MEHLDADRAAELPSTSRGISNVWPPRRVAPDGAAYTKAGALSAVWQQNQFRLKQQWEMPSPVDCRACKRDWGSGCHPGAIPMATMLEWELAAYYLKLTCKGIYTPRVEIKTAGRTRAYILMRYKFYFSSIRTLIGPPPAVWQLDAVHNGTPWAYAEDWASDDGTPWGLRAV